MPSASRLVSDTPLKCWHLTLLKIRLSFKKIHISSYLEKYKEQPCWTLPLPTNPDAHVWVGSGFPVQCKFPETLSTACPCNYTSATVLVLKHPSLETCKINPHPLNIVRSWLALPFSRTLLCDARSLSRRDRSPRAGGSELRERQVLGSQDVLIEAALPGVVDGDEHTGHNCEEHEDDQGHQARS